MTIESRLTALETITGAITEAQNDKVDLADGKTQSDVDYVVESKVPTSSDPTWYRVYKSGWIEQGGLSSSVSTASTTITFSKTMSDTNYTYQLTPLRTATSGGAAYAFVAYTLTTTNMTVYCHESVSCACRWEVKGMGA